MAPNLTAVKVRIGYGLATQGMPGDGERWARFVDDLERLRFDSVWYSERLLGSAPDPLVAMAFTAGRTRRLKFGMSVMVLPGRNPLLLAKELASLDLLSGGRLLPAFGLGAADPREHAGFGVTREDRAPMFDEALGLMRRLWSEDHVTHEGRFYRCDDVTLEPKPAQSTLSCWLGGNAPSELRRVGRLSDGWLPSFVTPEEVVEKRKLVEDAADKAGRAIDPEHYGVLILYASGELPQTGFVARIRERRPDADLASIVPSGMGAVRDLVRRFVDVGFSKFVLVPATPAASAEAATAELELVAEQVLPLQT